MSEHAAVYDSVSAYVRPAIAFCDSAEASYNVVRHSSEALYRLRDLTPINAGKFSDFVFMLHKKHDLTKKNGRSDNRVKHFLNGDFAMGTNELAFTLRQSAHLDYPDTHAYPQLAAMFMAAGVSSGAFEALSLENTWRANCRTSEADIQSHLAEIERQPRPDEIWTVMFRKEFALRI